MHWQCAYLVLWVCLNWVYTVVSLENNNNLLLHVVDLCLWQCIVFFSCTLPYLCYTILLLLLCWFVLYQYCCHNLIHGAVSFTTTTPGCYNSGCLPATYIYIYILYYCYVFYGVHGVVMSLVSITMCCYLQPPDLLTSLLLYVTES